MRNCAVSIVCQEMAGLTFLIVPAWKAACVSLVLLTPVLMMSQCLWCKHIHPQSQLWVRAKSSTWPVGQADGLESLCRLSA